MNALGTVIKKGIVLTSDMLEKLATVGCAVKALDADYGWRDGSSHIVIVENPQDAKRIHWDDIQGPYWEVHKDNDNWVVGNRHNA
jgi:hypothetical protein